MLVVGAVAHTREMLQRQIGFVLGQLRADLNRDQAVLSAPEHQQGLSHPPQ